MIGFNGQISIAKIFNCSQNRTQIKLRFLITENDSLLFVYALSENIAYSFIFFHEYPKSKTEFQENKKTVRLEH